MNSTLKTAAILTAVSASGAARAVRADRGPLAPVQAPRWVSSILLLMAVGISLPFVLFFLLLLATVLRSL